MYIQTCPHEQRFDCGGYGKSGIPSHNCPEMMNSRMPRQRLWLGGAHNQAPARGDKLVSSVEHDLSDCKAPSIKSKDYHPASVAVVFE